MTIIDKLSIAALGILVYILSWFWVSSLISSAINQWWSTRGKYRTEMDEKVERFLSKMDRDLN